MAVDRTYRGYVGPADQYDLIGAAQFSLLYALGLRQHHRLLDLGCGSLRAGRMLIPYLDPQRYVGVEPNTWLIDEAIQHEVGQDLITIKQPQFVARDSWELADLGEFSFVLAQGILTNAGPMLVPVILRAVREALAPDAIAAVTVVHTDTRDTTAVPVDADDLTAAPWLYPHCYAYEPNAIARFINAAGLCGERVPWYHPRHTWWLLTREVDAMPPGAFRDQLRGPTLAGGCERSW